MGEGPTIIVVDDDPNRLNSTTRLLEMGGFRLLQASSGKDCLRLSREEKPDLILLELALSDVEYRHLCQRLRSETGSGPIQVIVSSNPKTQSEPESAAQGIVADDYVVRSISNDDLLERVQMLLQLKRAAQALRESEYQFSGEPSDLREAGWSFDRKGIILHWDPASENMYGWAFEEVVGKIVAESGLTGIWSTDTEQNLVYVNPVLAQMLGYNLDELVGTNLIALADNIEFRRYVEGAQQGNQGTPAHNETVWRRKDGRPLYGSVAVSPLYTSDGELAGTFGVFVDITEQKIAKMALEQRDQAIAVMNAIITATSQSLELDKILTTSLHCIQDLMKIESGGIWLADPAGVTLNLTAQRGLSEELVADLNSVKLDNRTLKALRYLDSLPGSIPSDVKTTHPIFLHRIQAAMAREGTATAYAVPIMLRAREDILGLMLLFGRESLQSSDTDRQLLSSVAQQIAAATEKAQLYDALQQELGERMRAESALQRLNATLEDQVAARSSQVRAEQEKIEAILRCAGDAITVMDLEMRVQYVNAAYSALTGYSEAEITGQPASFLWFEETPKQNGRSLMVEIEGSEPYRKDAVLRCKDGRTVDVAVTCAPVRDAHGQLFGWVISHRDISHSRQLDKARSQFMSSVSHELRTPLASLKLYAWLLKQGRRPDEADHYVQMIVEQADRLGRTIQDILEMAELDSSHVIMDKKPVQVPLLIDTVVERYQERAEEASLTLQVLAVPPDLPAVFGDTVRLTQALGELVENALMYTLSGGLVELEASAAQHEGLQWVVISVRDTGPGISVEEQEHVFERLFRGEVAHTGNIPGSGLGLSKVDEIMRAHGGQVTVQSELGKGSLFALWLQSLS